jgi:hypothetical protein
VPARRRASRGPNRFWGVGPGVWVLPRFRAPCYVAPLTEGAEMLWMMLMGCSMLLGGGDEAGECDLSLEGLGGTTWVMLQAMPDKTERPNPQARIRFEGTGSDVTAKYTVMSVSDVYEYPCTLRTAEDGGTELFCAEEQRVVDWCQAILVADELCTKKALRKMGATGTDEELNKQIIEAKAIVAKYRGTPQWDQFKLNNNSLANKLQGRLYIKVEDRNCRLSVGDFYWTIYNGHGKEDTNPVGQNPFVRGDDDLMFEHCTDGQFMAPLPSAEVPADLSTYARPEFIEKGKPTFYTYLRPEATQKAEDGCTYSMDTYAKWKPLQKGVAVTLGADGALTWQAEHSWDAATIHPYNAKNDVGVFTMIRNKECGGKKERIDVVCDMVIVK